MNKELAKLIINEIEYRGIEKEINHLLVRNDFKLDFLKYSEESNSWDFWWMMTEISTFMKEYHS